MCLCFWKDWHLENAKNSNSAWFFGEINREAEKIFRSGLQLYRVFLSRKCCAVQSAKLCKATNSGACILSGPNSRNNYSCRISFTQERLTIGVLKSTVECFIKTREMFASERSN